MSRTVAAFFAHPDDEAFAAGGLLALAARCGAEVQVVSATRGEGATDRTGTAGGEGLAQRRSAELGASCRALGAADPHFLGLPDGAVRSDGAAEALAPHLASLAPDLIVTLGPDGAYGHPDHIACTRALAELAPVAPVLHAVFPPGLFSEVAKSLAGLGLVSGPPEELGVAPDAVDLRLPLDDGLAARKREALASHRSQLVHGEPRSFLREGLVDPLLREEWYQLASGRLPLEADALERWLSA